MAARVDAFAGVDAWLATARVCTRMLSCMLLAIAGVATAHAGLIEVIAEVKPSVLPIGTFNAVENPRFSFRGTAFVVGDGSLLVTNAHVLPELQAGQIKEGKLVALIRVGGGGANGELRTLELLKLDKSKDLALLRIEGARLPALRLSDAQSAKEGMSIAFIGFPIGGALGFSPVSHHGIISSVTPIVLPTAQSQQLNARAVRQLRDGGFNILQLDATAYPGNSGGPVFSAVTGEVVGVINMVLVKGSKETALSHPSGISYAIPVDFVHELMAAP